MKKVSVILPIYKVEQYLAACLKTVTEQTYPELEIILVIDGSSDRSAEIAYEWAQKDDRILVIEQENAGSGPARNNGLSHATGDYVMFVDPDDWIEREMTETLVRAMEESNVDYVVSGCVFEYEQDGSLVRRREDAFQAELLDRTALRQRYVAMLCGGMVDAPTKKLYRRECIVQNGVLFPDYRRSQDIVFNLRYIDCISSMRVLDQNYYHYRVDHASYSKKLSYNYPKTLSNIYAEMTATMGGWGISLSEEDERNLNNYFFQPFVWCISFGGEGKRMREIVSDENIRAFVGGGVPVDWKQRLLRRLILGRHVKLLNLCVAVQRKLKRH